MGLECYMGVEILRCPVTMVILGYDNLEAVNESVERKGLNCTTCKSCTSELEMSRWNV